MMLIYSLCTLGSIEISGGNAPFRMIALYVSHSGRRLVNDFLMLFIWKYARFVLLILF